MAEKKGNMPRHEIGDRIYEAAIGLNGISQILSYIEQCESEGDEFSKSHFLILEMLTQRISRDLLEIYADL